MTAYLRLLTSFKRMQGFECNSAGFVLSCLTGIYWLVWLQQMQLQYQRHMQMTMQQQLRAQQALMQAQLRAAQAQVQQYQEQVHLHAASLLHAKYDVGSSEVHHLTTPAHTSLLSSNVCTEHRLAAYTPSPGWQVL